LIFVLITYSTYAPLSGCSGGDNLEGFAYVKAIGGITTEAQYAYNALDLTCDNTKRNFLITVTDTYVVTGERAMIYHVLNVGPLNVYIDATKIYAYTGGVFDDCPTSNVVLNHAVTIVGVDTVLRFWLIRNTWGTGWGLKGFMRLKMVSTYVHVYIHTYIHT
jgi:C1A family cysteine protease